MRHVNMYWLKKCYNTIVLYWTHPEAFSSKVHFLGLELFSNNYNYTSAALRIICDTRALHNIILCMSLFEKCATCVPKRFIIISTLDFYSWRERESELTRFGIIYRSFEFNFEPRLYPNLIDIDCFFAHITTKMCRQPCQILTLIRGKTDGCIICTRV